MIKSKVLFCAPSPSNNGGITIWSSVIINAFFQRDTKIDLVHMPIDRSVTLTHLLPRYKKMWYALKDYLFFPIKLMRFLYKGHFDVAHITSVGGGGSIRDFFFVMVCKLFHVRAIIHYHFGKLSDQLNSKTFLSKLLLIIISKADQIVVLDEKSYLSIKSRGIDKVHIIPNPVPIISENPEIENQRQSRKLLFVGHVVQEKGIFELIEAVQNIPNISLHVYGPIHDKVRDEIYSKFKKLDFVYFYGKRSSEEIYRSMKNSTLFVLPTYSEGFPMVILEAMACKCPIISTPVGAIKEMLTYKGEIAGYLVPTHDSLKLRSMILKCLETPSSLTRKSNIAYDKVMSTYNITVIKKQLETLWTV